MAGGEVTDFHAAISAALDREQALAEAAPPVFPLGVVGGATFRYYNAQTPARTLRRVEADRQMLAEHAPDRCGVAVKGLWVSECIGRYPCKVLRSLAARYDVEVPS